MMIPRFIAQCEQEALHLSGAIQAYGCLLQLNKQREIIAVSDNVARILGEDLHYWLGLPLPKTLSQQIPHTEKWTETRLYLLAIPYQSQFLDGIVTPTADGGLLLELWPAEEIPDLPVLSYATLMNSVSDILAAKQKLVQQVFELSGFDRVMYYRFRDDEDGEVVAETRRPSVYGTYLDLRFPASDIPQIARKLYVRNPWRMIPDATAETVTLVAQHSQAIDLSLVDLRSVSPIHCIYLANMGVRASLSFPVVINGRLRSLIACHHAEPRVLSLSVLLRIAELVRLFGLQLTAFQAEHRMKLVDGLEYRFNSVRELLSCHGTDLNSAWLTMLQWLCQQFQLDGACVCVGESVLAHGTTLEATNLALVDQWFMQQADAVWLGDSLMRQLPGYSFSAVSGLLAIKARLKNGQTLRLYFCRCEHIYQVSWGGNPEKPAEQHDGLFGITPRRSFEQWVEKRMGYSLPWNNENRLMALKLRELLLNCP